jgi:SAM-dependent methyltransferase
MQIMSDALADLLRCPTCHQNVKVIAHGNVSTTNCARQCTSGNEVATLNCMCGATYPVMDGVPRLVESAVNPDSDTLAKSPNDYDIIRQSFSKEWGFFDYDTDKTWGWTLDERKKVFLADVGLRESDIKGKLVLDAGCGNGTLTAALGGLGMEVVGIDLSDRLSAANLHKSLYAGRNSNHVHYVQGNLCNPPLKHGGFDLVYSSGVIHHTPDSKETFAKLAPLVKRQGRLYVWVYGKRSLPVRLFFGSGRQLKRFMSLDSLMTICRLVAPFYRCGTQILDGIGIAKFRKRSNREITLDLFDGWAPKFNHWHLESEVMAWFADLGFANITISGRQKHGFGCYGDKL